MLRPGTLPCKGFTRRRLRFVVDIGGRFRFAKGRCKTGDDDQLNHRTRQKEITTGDARLVASATDTRGDTIELWILDAEAGFGNLIVEKRPDGTLNGASIGCDAQPRSSALDAGQPDAVAPNRTDNQATLVRLYGWVPQPAMTAYVTLSDGTIVTAEVSSDGYFLQPVTIQPNAGIDVTHIRAIASDGAVIAERDLP